MCSVRRSNPFRPITWMVTLLALFVFALAPAGWAAVYIETGQGGTEGDPTDGLGLRGGGGILGDGTTTDSEKEQDQPKDTVKPQYPSVFIVTSPYTFIDAGLFGLPQMIYFHLCTELGGNR